MNFQVIVIAIGVSISLGFVGGWKLNSWKHDSDRLAETEAQQAALISVAEEIAKIDVKNTTVRQKVVEHVIEKPVYVDCKHDADGMRNINEAITGQSDADPELPEADEVNER